MPAKVLNDDWSDYDDRKIRDRRDAKDFACTESWEVDYLIRKIQKNYPAYTEMQIRAAISACCTSLRSPHPRIGFVQCVMARLRT